MTLLLPFFEAGVTGKVGFGGGGFTFTCTDVAPGGFGGFVPLAAPRLAPLGDSVLALATGFFFPAGGGIDSPGGGATATSLLPSASPCPSCCTRGFAFAFTFPALEPGDVDAGEATTLRTRLPPAVAAADGAFAATDFLRLTVPGRPAVGGLAPPGPSIAAAQLTAGTNNATAVPTV